MPNLESIVRERFNSAEGFLIRQLNLNEKDIAILDANKPKIVVDDSLGIYAGYDFKNNRIVYSSHAAKNLNNVVDGEEAFHSIRLRLNMVARDYLLAPISKVKEAVNRAKEKFNEYIARVNLEEYYARLCALSYANHKWQTDHNELWSRIKNNIIALTKSFDCISHFIGYRKAEEDFKKGFKEFNSGMIYDNNTSKIEHEIKTYKLAT